MEEGREEGGREREKREDKVEKRDWEERERELYRHLSYCKASTFLKKKWFAKWLRTIGLVESRV